MKQDPQYMSKLAQTLSNERLELHILPTEKCNFRCTYCYEKFENGRMRPAVINGIKNLISRRAAQYKELHISWFGGEPLVASDILLDISQHARNVCAEHKARFIGSATTNGWFLDLNMMKKLTDEGVSSFQITLDGPKSLHDTSRIMINKNGTFDRIWKNLTDLRQSTLEFKILIRLHLRPSTQAAILDWFPELRAALLQDHRFSLLVKAVEHLGGPNDTQIDVYRSNEEKDQALSPFFNALSVETPQNDDIRKSACYACRPNAWMIRSDGRLGRCTVLLEDDRNTVGQITEEGDLVIDQSKLSPWLKGLADFNPDVIGCPAQHLA